MFLMRRFGAFKAFLTVFLLSFLPPLSASAQDTKTDQSDVNLRILFFSNMPEIDAADDRPGLARVATYVKNIRTKNMNTFVIHGGDSLSPSVLSSLDRGAHMIDILNTLEPDVMTVAKREFAYGEDILIQRAGEALFPFVSSNTLDMATNSPFETISPNEIFDVGGVQIGLVVLTSPQLVEEYATQRTIVSDSMIAAISQAKTLREQGADIIVLTADFDLSSINGFFDKGQFDIVLQSTNKTGKYVKKGRTYFLTEHGNDKNLTDIHLTVSRASGGFNIKSINVNHPDLMQLPKDGEVNSIIKMHSEPLQNLLGITLGATTVELNTIRNNVRSAENAFANMLADSMREAMQSDVAIINGGSIRGNTTYKAGHFLSRNNLQEELPFRNTITKLSVTGQQIWDAIEYGIACRFEFDGCFPQVSNIQAEYSLSDRKLVSLKIAGKEVNMNSSYTLATTDFLAIGGDGYEMFKSSARVKSANSGQLTREILSKYILQRKTVSPVINNRLLLKQ